MRQGVLVAAFLAYVVCLVSFMNGYLSGGAFREVLSVVRLFAR